MDEKKIKVSLQKFATDRDWNKFHTPKNLAISISLEASELLEIFQWSNEKTSFYQKIDMRKKISEEVADIALYLIRFCDLMNLDLEKICLEKIRLNKKKYPIHLSKGSSKKYTQLNENKNFSFQRRANYLRKNLIKRKGK